MKGRFLLSSHAFPKEENIYAKRSALVLDWLLRNGRKDMTFSLREIASETGVSLGLVQRVLATLVFHGVVETHGLRTAKMFSLKSKMKLLSLWAAHYNILKKCKIWNYASAYSPDELTQVLSHSLLRNKVAFALHSAARVMGLSNTNLKTLELYLLDSSERKKIEKILKLEPKEMGYDVLLIEPYYRDLLVQSKEEKEKIKRASWILTYLDLYHFPLRGSEQAQYLLEKHSGHESILDA